MHRNIMEQAHEDMAKENLRRHSYIGASFAVMEFILHDADEGDLRAILELTNQELQLCQSQSLVEDQEQEKA